MRNRNGMRIAVAVALLITAAAGWADCVTTTVPISAPFVFPNRFAGPVASTGSTIALAKIDSDSSTKAIYLATYDSNVNPLTQDRKVVDVTPNGPAALFWTGSEFGLFYQTSSFALVLQRSDVSGNLIGAPIPIKHSWSPTDEFDIAWAPARNGYAIVHLVSAGPDLGIWLTVISPSGSVLSDLNVTVFARPPATPRVVPLPDGTVGVLWSRFDEPPQVFLSLDSPSSSVPKTVTVAAGLITTPLIATDGRSILIIYSSATASGGTELHDSVVDLAGNVLSSDSFFLSGTGIDIAPLSLFWNSALSEWALVYVDATIGLNVFPGDTRLRRFASLSSTASDTLLSPDPLHSRLLAPYPIVFINGGYVGSIERVLSRVEGSESYVVKSCPFFVTASADHAIWRPYVPVTFTATPSGGKPGYTYQWDFGDLSQQSGSTVQHVYLLPGTYTVTLTGTDAAGARSISKLTVQVSFPRGRAVRH